MIRTHRPKLKICQNERYPGQVENELKAKVPKFWIILLRNVTPLVPKSYEWHDYPCPLYPPQVIQIVYKVCLVCL